MSANLNAQETNNAVNRNVGFAWNRLRSERENICEALLKESRPVSVPQAGFAGVSKADAPDSETWHRDLLQARLTKIDDALDRLMAGSYGNCAKCGRWIEDTKLYFDPAIAFCIDCWQRMQTQH